MDLAERILRMSQAVTVVPPSSRSGSFDFIDAETNPYFSVAAGGFVPTSLTDCKIRFAVLRQRWAVGDRRDAVEALAALIDAMSNSSLDLKDNGSNITTRTPTPSSVSHGSSSTPSSLLYLDCLLKLGQWKLALLPPSVPVDSETRRTVVALYSKATVMNPQSYRAWHEWGLANYRAAEEIRGRTGARRFSRTTGLLVNSLTNTGAKLVIFYFLRFLFKIFIFKLMLLK
jgi:hypothetical protein